jgi:hypothetical protein
MPIPRTGYSHNEFHLSNVAIFLEERLKKAPLKFLRGFLFFYRPVVPEPGPVGARVDPLGDALGPRVLPDGL